MEVTWTTRVRHEIEALERHRHRHDEAGALRSLDVLRELQPRSLAAQADAEEIEGLIRPWLEAWDGLVQGWWLERDGEGAGVGPLAPWRRLLLPGREQRELRALELLPLYLRQVDSPRLGDAELPADLGALGLDEQARALGRFTLRADGGSPCDYATAFRALEPELRPSLARWLLGVHLISPLTVTDERVNEHRRRAMAGFAEIHGEGSAEDEGFELAPELLFGSAAYRACLIEDRATPFIRALSRVALEPGFRSLVRRAERADSSRGPKGRGKRAGSKAKPTSRKPRGVGIVLTCWTEDHAVRRCMDPLLPRTLEQGPRAYVIDPEPDAAAERLPADWRDERVRLRREAAVQLPELARAAARIRADALDFLFYPEVGLSGPSRWLATQRLARVQATSQGHPVSTGSSAMDYFIGGVEIERDPARYSERLVLLPGVGCGSTRPPAPSVARRRPLCGEPVRFVSLATHDKLNPGVTGTWNHVLAASAGSCGPAELELVPALEGRAWREAEATLRHALAAGKPKVYPRIPRQACVDLLVDADVYLEPFPYAGYNSTIEALSAGLPVVTMKLPGTHGMASTSLISMLGLPDFLVATSVEEYVAAAVRLATDEGLRLELRAMLERERVLKILCDVDHSAHFEAAVEWMRDAGPQNPGPPVYIEAGEPPRFLEGDEPWPIR